MNECETDLKTDTENALKKAINKITIFEAKNELLEEQIEKMKCCENCKHSDTECEGYTICGIGHYDDCLSNKIFDHTTDEKDYWEIKEND